MTNQMSLVKVINTTRKLVKQEKYAEIVKRVLNGMNSDLSDPIKIQSTIRVLKNKQVTHKIPNWTGFIYHVKDYMRNEGFTEDEIVVSLFLKDGE